MIIFFVIIFFIIFLYFFFKKGKNKGESIVIKRLNKLDKNKYRVLNNILFDFNGITTQIDHIVVSVYGIFVIETKNLKGIIIGNEDSIEWVQRIYNNKYHFYNPIRQNKYHIDFLKRVLTDYNFIVSIIVFTNKAILKTKTKTSVVYDKNLNKKIMYYNREIFNNRDVERIVKTIELYNLSNDKKVLKKHIYNIKRKLKIQNKKIKSGKCPFCDSKLLKKKKNNNFFLVCEKFPNCRFKMEINTHWWSRWLW